MGRVKDWAIDRERQQREAMEALPASVEQSARVIAELHAETSRLQALVRELRDQIRVQGSAYEKYKSYVIGGLIGAVISMLIAAAAL